MNDEALGKLREARALLLEERDNDGNSRELSVTLTEIDTAILWRQHDLQIKSPLKDEVADKSTEQKIREIVLEEYKRGNIVVSTFEGLKVAPLHEIIKQPVEGLLYDLNRGQEVILKFIDDPKWVNDFAMMQVVKELKRLLDGIKSGEPISADFEKLKELILMRLSPNEAYSSDQMDKMINEKINEIITNYQDQP